MRVGRVVSVEEFPEARKPAWRLTIDFGSEIGPGGRTGISDRLSTVEPWPA